MLDRLLPTLICTLALTACNGYFGSSDDSDSGGGSNSDVQGIWDGTLTSSSLYMDMLATPNNEIWAISWNDAFNQVGQLTRGTGSLNGNVFSGSGHTFPAGQSSTVSSVSLSGTVSSGASFDGNLGQNVTFTSTFDSDYNQAYDASTFAGAWQGRDSTSSPVTFTIQSNGSFTAQSTVSGKPSTCAISGSLAKPSSGKNYATATFTVGTTNCTAQLGNTSMTGVAFLINKTGQQPLLLIAGTNTGQSLAWYAYARKNATASTGTDTGAGTETGSDTGTGSSTD